MVGHLASKSSFWKESQPSIALISAFVVLSTCELRKLAEVSEMALAKLVQFLTIFNLK